MCIRDRSDTYPYIDIQEDDTTMTHEATVGKISADQIFYLMSRGLTENEATNLIVQASWRSSRRSSRWSTPSSSTAS